MLIHHGNWTVIAEDANYDLLNYVAPTRKRPYTVKSKNQLNNDLNHIVNAVKKVKKAFKKELASMCALQDVNSPCPMVVTQDEDHIRALWQQIENLKLVSQLENLSDSMKKMYSDFF